MTSRLDEQAEKEARDLARMNAAREETKAQRRKAAKAATSKVTTKVHARFDVIEGDGIEHAGVYYIGTGRNGDGEEVDLSPQWICSPLHVAAYTRDAQGNEWGRLLAFRDPDGLIHRVAVPMALLAGTGEDLRALLLSHGLRIATDKGPRSRLIEYIAQANPDKKARCVTRTGWHGSAFVLPTETFGDAGGEEIILQSSSAEGVALTLAGTLTDWRTRVAMPCAGNSRLVLALSAAFAAPCLSMVDAEGGGIHFRGGSSSGKTTALLVAASVYGPAPFMRTWRATDNALESVASLHSDMLLPLDEIGQLEPRAAGGAAYMLANGTGKARSHRDGSARAAARFRVLFLSAGEIGLADLVREGGGKVRAGHEVRVIDIPAEPEGSVTGIFERIPEGITPGRFAEQLKRTAVEHHGHAFAEWLRYLTGNADAARAALRAKADELLKQLVLTDAAGQVRRVAQRFALIGAAGELATDQGLTGWQSGDADLASYVCFRAWLKARGTDGDAEPASMLAQVRQFIEAHGDARFPPADRTDDHRPNVPNRAGWRKDSEADGRLYFILPETFRNDVCKGFDHLAVARALRTAGALKCEEKGYTRSERVPAEGSKLRVYVVIGRKLLGDGSDSDGSDPATVAYDPPPQVWPEAA